MHYWLVMPAAGSGKRFGGAIPKQHLPLAGATVLELALRPFLDDTRCRMLVLALAADDAFRIDLSARLGPKVQVVIGGAERVDSVVAALRSLRDQAGDQDWVLVHDAVRPCLSAADLDQLLQSGAASADGALLATPLADTLKRADENACVETTVSREHLWRALTPQMFRYRRLLDALTAAQAAGRRPTDEAQAIEWQGGQPLLVAARDINVKITTENDLPVAAAAIAARG
jgi:2-C-methyl-D-erythritol 4-phosphate cytidylyltransferase